MLFISLNSFKSAILILVNLPFSVVGGILAIYFLNINLSVSAFIGFIALLGIGVENGLVLVSFFEQLRMEGKKVYDAVIEACRLFDLTADPRERRNLAAREPARVAEFRARVAGVEATAVGEGPLLSADEHAAVEARLRDLGYIE